MTVCAAAICKMGQDDVIVAIADRMLTWAKELEFESGATKMYGFAPANAICLGAGTTDVCFEICVETHRGVNGTTDINSLAAAYASNQTLLRRRRLERLYLTPLGLDLNSFISRQAEMDPAIASDIADRMISNEGDLEVESLIVGFDSSGAHIYHVYDPGISVCCDGSGFMAIGSGERSFNYAAMAPGLDRSWPLHIALFLMYSAKIQAERAPGVGRNTDIYVLHQRGHHMFTPEETKALAEYHDDFQKRAALVRSDVIKAMLESDRVLKRAKEKSEPPGSAPQPE